MKIAILNHSFPPDVGGGETQAYLIAEKLAQLGNRVTVITGETDILPAPPFKIVMLPHFKQFERGEVGFKPFIKELKDAVLGEDYDIIYCLNFSSIIALSFFRDLLHSKIVFTFHCGISRELKKVIGYFNDWELEVSFVKNIINSFPLDHIVFPSQLFYEWGVLFGVHPEKASIIYNSVKVPIQRVDKFSRAEWRRKHGVPLDKIMIVTPIRLLEKKGIYDLINAIPLVKDPVFWYIPTSLKKGDHVVKENVENLISKLNIGDRVKIAYDEHNIIDMPDVYLSSDIFVLPSHHEMFSVSILEAMSFKIPVLCSDIPGNKEIIENMKNGILFASKNSVDLASKMCYILQNKDIRGDIIDEAYSLIEKKLNTDIQVTKLNELFQLLLN